ncbi:hypothetical protein HUW51_17065 [Adhaeribacter swui]|uniref:Uncharacterized protein n=1 Tax=Adhaeribacter swui TaxID=2086471 RepID=A0A7G7GB15_9BACT|nr:hypothetical protein [Adhaeribacter swui]QNF34349.1 hypothetical protein HUW51_17065 [Adhaeribacter swui]
MSETPEVIQSTTSPQTLDEIKAAAMLAATNAQQAAVNAAAAASNAAQAIADAMALLNGTDNMTQFSEALQDLSEQLTNLPPLTRESLLIDKVDNTPDAAKPVSVAQQSALEAKSDKINSKYVVLGAAVNGVVTIACNPEEPYVKCTVGANTAIVIEDITPDHRGLLKLKKTNGNEVVTFQNALLAPVGFTASTGAGSIDFYQFELDEDSGRIFVFPVPFGAVPVVAPTKWLPPLNFKGVSNGTNAVALTWEKRAGSYQVHIYRATKPDFSDQGTIYQSNGSSYNDTGFSAAFPNGTLVDGKTYYYRIKTRSYNGLDESVYVNIQVTV